VRLFPIGGAGPAKTHRGAKPKRRGAPIEVDVVQSEDGAEGLGKGLDGDRGVVPGLSG